MFVEANGGKVPWKRLQRRSITAQTGACPLVIWNKSKPHFVDLLSQEQEFVSWLASKPRRFERRGSSFSGISGAPA